MPLHRHFLSDTTPVLHQAVAWLRSHYPPTGPTWDLHRLTIAVPGRRAVRRLTELLVERAGDAGLLTPTIVTTGDLPEQLYEATTPVASDLQSNLSWIRAAQNSPELRALLPHSPEPDDLGSWWSLAEQFRAVLGDLAAAGLDPAAVPARCAAAGLPLPEPDRWQALAAAARRHTEILGAMGLRERHEARRAVLAAGQVRAVGDVVLIGVLDLTPVLAGMLRALDSNATALVHAEDALAGTFDDLGALDVDAWHDRPVDVAEGRVHAVERPFDQGRQAVSRLAATNAPGPDGGSQLRIDDITVGLGDEGDVDAIRHALQLAGLPTRYAAGRPLATAAPVTVLAALARLAERRRVRDLADLLRHPDVEDYLHAAGKDQTDWMSLLDRYAAGHFPVQVGDEWLGDRASRLAFLWRCVERLLPDTPMQSLPLPEWCEPIREALRRLYGGRALHREHDDDAGVLRALERLAALLDEHQRLDPTHTITPSVGFAGAVDLLLRRLEAETIPEEGGIAAVELLGFLELPLDDAPVLVVTGLNEGRVPRVRGADPLLPDGLRRALGLDDNRRRYAHAVCALHTILRTRPTVDLISARWSAERDPLAPSRLLLACDDDTRLRRLEVFYGPIGKARRAAQPGPVLIRPGAATRFLPPAPPLDDTAPLPECLSVTAFRDYIACPYRFYLRRVLRLEGPEEPGDELDGALFGSLAHTVLEAFGRGDIAASSEPAAIEAFLIDALADQVAAQFGSALRPAIAVQLDQLRLRLRMFAEKQAALAAEGWRIHRVELSDGVPFPVDGQPFTLSGRVDRIDVHPQRGVRVIDYKTSDTARKPEQAHRRGRVEWIDLQLPLYRELIRPLGLQDDVELAYFNLPRRPEEAGISAAGWSPLEVDEAVETARQVVRRIRQRDFWPPGDPAQFPDEFVRLCADNALERRELLALATAAREAAA